MSDDRPTILICGSREASPVLLDYARRATLRALENGWWIIAGDAVGIDQAVAETVRDHFHHKDEMMLGMRVYGLGDAPRHGVMQHPVDYCKLRNYNERTTSGSAGRIFLREYVIPVKTYQQRDECMVRLADKVLCIWNGMSKGTLAVYEYAESLEKEAWLKHEEITR
jgi:uncharacterized phage-like protein YoqJ